MVEEGRMTFNHAFRTGLSVTLIATAISVSGCSTLFGHSPPAKESATTPQESGPAFTAEPELAATDAAIRADEQSGTKSEAAPAPTADVIKPTAPTQYTVKPG